MLSAIYGWSVASLSAVYGWVVAHDVFRAFAGPSATITAAIVVTRTTRKFSQIQAEIAQLQATTARQQAETASDRLRLDLFDKRYRIYDTAQQLIKLLEEKIPSRTLEANEVTEKLIILDEAVFYFPQDICEHIKTLGDACQTWASQHIQREGNGPDSPDWQSSSREMVDNLRNMKALRGSMPEIFEPIMGFAHIARIST